MCYSSKMHLEVKYEWFFHDLIIQTIRFNYEPFFGLKCCRLFEHLRYSLLSVVVSLVCFCGWVFYFFKFWVTQKNLDLVLIWYSKFQNRSCRSEKEIDAAFFIQLSVCVVDSYIMYETPRYVTGVAVFKPFSFQHERLCGRHWVCWFEVCVTDTRGNHKLHCVVQSWVQHKLVYSVCGLVIETWGKLRGDLGNARQSVISRMLIIAAGMIRYVLFGL